VADGLGPCLATVAQGISEEVSQLVGLFETESQHPPVPRHQPPVAGALSWARSMQGRSSTARRQLEAVPSRVRGSVAVEAFDALDTLDQRIAAFVGEHVGRWTARAAAVRPTALDIPLLEVQGITSGGGANSHAGDGAVDGTAGAAAFEAELPIVVVNFAPGLNELLRE
jgi:hypothetical protein